MQFQGKIWFVILLKVTRNRGFTLPLENTVLEKLQESTNWPTSLLRVKPLNQWIFLRRFTFSNNEKRKKKKKKEKTPETINIAKQQILITSEIAKFDFKHSIQY